jgi:hypothetical protein
MNSDDFHKKLHSLGIIKRGALSFLPWPGEGGKKNPKYKIPIPNVPSRVLIILEIGI